MAEVEMEHDPEKGKCDLSGMVLGKLGWYKRGWYLDLEEGDKI